MTTPPPEEDAELMRRIAQRDAEAFRMLADKYMLKSIHFAERMVGSRAQAEDIVQDTFEAIWKQAPTWQPLAKFTTWLHRVLLNNVHQRYRDRHRFYAEPDETIEDDTPSAEQSMIRDERSDAVRAALQELPERQRTAIVLFYYQELSQQDACQVMGISEGALESLLSRGRQQLKRALGSRDLH